LLHSVDHLVCATPNLDRTVEDLAVRLGVRASAGGQHPGRGTRNALIALSPRSYLEIIGPDEEQPEWSGPRWFGIDTLSSPRLATWAVKAPGLTEVAERARGAGVALGPVANGRRRRPDGTLLQWQFTDPATLVGDGLVPFLIDWGAGPHPAEGAPGGAELIGLRGEHPDPERIRRALAVLGVELQVERGGRAALVATLRTALGLLDLR